MMKRQQRGTILVSVQQEVVDGVCAIITYIYLAHMEHGNQMQKILQCEVGNFGHRYVQDPVNIVLLVQLVSSIFFKWLEGFLTCLLDEGTPDIVEKRDGYFYVTFHGYDNNAKKAARGVARTADFVNWQISGFSLPGDSIFSPLDCNPWNISWAAGGCVGGGEGSIMKSGDYYYMLIEAPDVSLSCNTQRGVQNW